MGNASTRDRLTASGFFVLRTPLLPFDEFAAWGSKLEAAAHVGDREALDDALRRDRMHLRERLCALVARRDFRDALFVASPTLEAVLDRWQREPDSDRGRKSEPALVAYFSRATTRATPFGLFAGCSTGTISDATRLRLESRERYRRHTRLDMEYLCALAEAVHADERLRRDLVYRPNSSLYEAGDRFHVVEASQAPGRRSYKLVAIDKTPYLEATLARAAEGATFRDLAAVLVDEEVTETDAEEYLGELVESQLLVGDVEPQLTGPEPSEALVRTFGTRQSTAYVAGQLEKAVNQLSAIDKDGLGTPRHEYEAIASTLIELPAQPQLARLVQVDLTKPAADLTLGQNVVQEILNGISILHAMTPPPQHDALARFRERFAERYETREVRLVEALDEEHGIGFELLNAATPRDGHPSSERHRLLLRKYSDALLAREDQITLEGAEVAAFAEAERRALPEGLEVVATIEAESPMAVDDGDFLISINSAAGPPGARLSARFCHADSSLHEHVAAQIRAEEATRLDCVFAELVHLPEDRAGNILSRPLLRDYEIPYLGRSAAPADRQLPVTDLLVSVEGGRIVLRSRRLGREVVPRLTTAHNFAFNSLAVYRFLAALQHQDVTPALLWDWGPLADAPYLPRVVTGRVLLSRARWTLHAADIAKLSTPGTSDGFAAVQALRKKRGLPRLVALADSDNELVVDLDNVLSLEALARELKNRPSASFVELFPDPKRLIADGPEGRFVHQLVVPFLNSVPAASASANGTRRASRTRRFVPGSEWLYARLFSGNGTTDVVLDRIARAVDAALVSGAADRWFFIRYGDPSWHLRLRIHGAPDRLLAETLPMLYALAKPLLDAGSLWRLQLDTYEREVERYGGDEGIELAEELFYADSEAVLALLRRLGTDDSYARWHAALAGIYFLLDDFEFTLNEKRALAAHACQSYAQEFGVTKNFQGEMSRRYRSERARIESLLYSSDDALLLSPLRARSNTVTAITRELRAREDAGRLTQRLPDLALSFAHMHVNRLLRSAQRAHELVLYEMLSRIYSSEAARSRSQVATR